MEKPDITSYAALDLLSWKEQGTLEVSPKFQRRSVWSTAAKGHFIDSILLGYAIPPIHIRITTGKNGKPIREVIDGQQRVRSVFEFIAGDYRIPSSVSPDWGGKGYDQLTDDERTRINLFSFTVYQYKRLTDSEVLDMFSRLNTYSVSLNLQELRNGRYFGQFKRESYALASESLEFWRKYGIFTELQIARMKEVELVSELLVAQLDGLQDKKSSIDLFYSKLDLKWGKETIAWEAGKVAPRLQPSNYLSSVESASRFRSTIGAIDESLGDLLRDSPFHRPALFYTLYCAIYHIEHGLPRSSELLLCAAGISHSTRVALRQVIGDLTEYADRPNLPWDDIVISFFEASARQTDNITPRVNRLSALIQMIDRAS